MENNIYNDQELYSYFVQRNETLCEDNFAYLMDHKEVKLLISDYLSNILLHKPDDVFKFTKDYFRILADAPETNKVLIVVGPQSVGKSLFINKLMTDFPDKFAFPRLSTTSDKNDDKFIHVGKEVFIQMINNKEFVFMNFTNNEYEGLSRGEIDKIHNEGKLRVSEATKTYNNGLEASYVAVLPPGIYTLRGRMIESLNENTAKINTLLEVAAKEITEIEASSIFSYRIINDLLEGSYSNFKNCVVSHFPKLDDKYEETMHLANYKWVSLDCQNENENEKENEIESENDNDKIGYSEV